MTNDKPEPSPARPAGSRRALLAAGALLVVAVAGSSAVLFGGVLKGRPAGDQACQAAVATAARIAPLIKGEVAALTAATTPLRLPDLAFEDGTGAAKKLSDFRGKTVLLNLWATWCVPCRKEMPALDGLQAKLGSDDFQVVAVNIDTRDAEKPKAFLNDAKLTRLAYFSDQKAKVFQDLKAVGRALGMPTSVLVDSNGCEIATIAGPAEWDSADAVKLIQAVTAKAAAGL
ncbi:thiol:disulfide interchange protein TlpA [Bradyrhizobium sp. SSBR45G]|uniref:thiol:disulfide interchange protein TlpA n=1 Tax=unclassified Bradyrhizobium TaxID=2631580 RepID=UPI00234297B8|nr:MULTISPECIES: TlpA disulfide reductase family protein [unclassified Bradyrhizobium]GLH82396.1 thiol:disulfide interchange protein TlpA [Bradyrhizobium sp. SSBR45G]GLH89842.1 thiol:disulfide interchange protein TlpA [Bradyrhizobium sp. SSBR45R]